ncbi:MAG: DUF4352 domain-containing protein [Ruminococcus sp.]|nr:DUF4352 domain-containing protein [Ruminococcus sp.]
MKYCKLTALILAAALALAPAAGCKHEKISSSDTTKYADNPDVGAVKINASLDEKVTANETEFSVNRVIDAGAQTENGEHYVYLDVTVRNTTATEYELSRLNNFYIVLPDGTEVSSAVRTELYAINNFSDQYKKSPFTVPAGGTFSGIIGGYVLREDQFDFTIGFFPTRENTEDKKNVILIPIKSSDIVPLPDELKK